jgi:hypothetical protein
MLRDENYQAGKINEYENNALSENLDDITKTCEKLN